MCEAVTPEGQPFSQVMEGFAARVLQHEIDHLDGVLFPDRFEKDQDHGQHALETGAPHA